MLPNAQIAKIKQYKLTKILNKNVVDESNLIFFTYKYQSTNLNLKKGS